MLIKNLFYFFILSKKIVHKPPQKKILIWDSDDSEIILKYFNKREAEIPLVVQAVAFPLNRNKWRLW